MNTAPVLVLAAYAAAGWPVWRWFVRRLQDGGDEPLGLVALVIAVAVLARSGRTDPSTACRHAALAGLGLTAVLALLPVPPLLRAVCYLPVLALAARGLLGVRLVPGAVALLLLALPVVASLQFWAGGPLRQCAAWMAAGLLSLGGFNASCSGVVLSVDGAPVVVDGPCSGVRLLWTACVAVAAFAAWSDWGWRRTAAALTIAMPAAVLANAWRTASLALGGAGVLPAAPWLHAATGLCALGAALTACFFLLRPRTA
jgi:exosortase/archaeosortase family protein